MRAATRQPAGANGESPPLATTRRPRSALLREQLIYFGQELSQEFLARFSLRALLTRNECLRDVQFVKRRRARERPARMIGGHPDAVLVPGPEDLNVLRRSRVGTPEHCFLAPLR